MADIRPNALVTEATAFEDDHFVPIDGTANGTKKMRLGRVIAAGRNALSVRGALAIDGSANAKVYTTLTGQNIGTDAASVVMVLRCPLTAPASELGLFNLASSNTTTVAANLQGSLPTDGALTVALTGATASDLRIAKVAGFVTAYGGK